MKAEELRALQAPFKKRYQEEPATALQTMTARGQLQEGVVCRVETFLGPLPAGLHPSAGGDASVACAGNMLLEALVGCSGVTLRAVATALDIPLRSGTIVAEGDLDFRGTLGVSKDVPIGFRDIRLKIELDSDAPPDKIETLIKLTKRYCVVYQTLENRPGMTVEVSKK